jgi:transposase
VCKQEISCSYGVGQAVRLRHLPILGQETYIVIRPKRAQCPTCQHQPTTTQTLKWYDQHTKAYDRYLMKLLIGSTVADVSLKENLGYDAVLGALERQVDKEVNWDEVQNLGTIGIDEVAHKKGRQSYRAVVTARQDDGTVIILTVLKNRKKDGKRVSNDNSTTAASYHPYLLLRYVGWLPGGYRRFYGRSSWNRSQGGD